jgi:hypothetical protein
VSEDDYKAFEGEYHYEAYRRADLRDHFGSFKEQKTLYSRIVNEIQYFAWLYQELRTDYSTASEHLFCNKLLEQNQQYLLIMSAVSLNDPQRENKIRTISAKFDQLYVILRILDLYESNKFQALIYELNNSLRNKIEPECRQVFDDLVIRILQDAQRLEQTFGRTIADVFSYEQMKGARNSGANFSKYLLMRIDRWLSQLLDKPSYCMETLPTLEERFNKTNRRRYGMHLEHIYAYHNVNRALFTDPGTGVFDGAAFEQTRNLLGMVLLLKDLQT